MFPSFSVGHIKKVDGLSGCYKGVGLRLCALALQSFTHVQVVEALEEGSDNDEDSKSSEVDLTPEEK